MPPSILPPSSVSSSREKPGITFSVDDVTPPAKLIWMESLADSLNRRFQRKIFALPDGEHPVTNAGVDSLLEKRVKVDVGRIGSQCHPLVDAVHIAFSQHRPLTLAPDDIWLVIAQGFSHHVSENAESLRRRLVRHQGKRELQVEASDLTLAGFEKAIADFSSLIQREIDPVLHETLICDFSTTNRAI